MDIFTVCNATMPWKSRVGSGPQDEPNIRFTEKASKAAVYGATQVYATATTDEMPAFNSTFFQLVSLNV